MHRLVDVILGIIKESIKTFSQEALNNTVKLINGLSALILAIIPGKARIFDGLHGWELRPTFKVPRLPRWMENGVSSFNTFLHEYSYQSDADAESEYESGLDDNDSTAPPSPSSQSPSLSRSSSLQHERQNGYGHFIMQFVSVVSWPFRHSFNVGRYSSSVREFERPGPRMSRLSSKGSSRSLTQMYGLASKQFASMKDYVVHRTTDKRRGVVEDLHLIVELSIERVFEVIRNALLYILSPLETLKAIMAKLYCKEIKNNEIVTAQTATLGDPDPALTWRQSRSTQAMNTDGRTCGDIITELGYPYEGIKVITEDGYILLLERIPRHDSRKVLYMQHGLLDSSLGWVSSGVVGSQAFAAYDQGYDVFLGNFRGLASRDHVDKNITKQRYWRYSVNEHGTQDIPAMLTKIHEIKVAELKSLQRVVEDGYNVDQQPYTMCGVAHSLGGAAILIYVVTRRLEGKPHWLSRLILLSPAGFHEEASIPCKCIQFLFPAIAPLLLPIMPGFYIPTKMFRMLFNKLARDFQNYPAIGGLVQTFFSYFAGGDSSNWMEIVGQSHFNMYDMPGVAYRVILHLAQMRSANRFIMYNFGSAEANMEAYGNPYPLDIGSNYNVIDIPVDIVAGRKDKLIPAVCVKSHYHLMKVKGCQVSYEEFDYAHLDFTFGHREELLAYVMSRLLLVTAPVSDINKERTCNSVHKIKKGKKTGEMH